MLDKILESDADVISLKARIGKGLKVYLVPSIGLLLLVIATFAAYATFGKANSNEVTLLDWSKIPVFEVSPPGINGQCQATWSPDHCKAEDITAAYVTTSSANGIAYLNFRIVTNAANSVAGSAVSDGSFQASAYIDCNLDGIDNQLADRVVTYRPDLDNVLFETGDQSLLIWGSFGPHGNDSPDGQFYRSDLEWRVPINQLPNTCQGKVGLYFTTSYYDGTPAQPPVITDSTKPANGIPLKTFNIATAKSKAGMTPNSLFETSQSSSIAGAGVVLLGGAVLIGLYWNRNR